MRPIAQVTSPADVQFYYAEDDYGIADRMIAGLRLFVGVPIKNIVHSPYVDEVQKYLETMDRTTPTVVILDNILDSTTRDNKLRGVDVAQDLVRRQSEFPNIQLVTVVSSDRGFVHSAIKEGGPNMGFEFWNKSTNMYLSLAWIAECLKNGQVISRKEWLEKNGIHNADFDSNQTRVPQEKKLANLCDAFMGCDTLDEAARYLRYDHLNVGDFFNFPSSEVMRKLGFDPRGKEGQRPLGERR